MKKLITNYTFDASAQTITFGDYTSIVLESVLLVTNVTDNIIIYNFADTARGGSASTNVLTLDYDTTSMSDTDDLQVYYDDTTYDFSKKIDSAAGSTDAGVPLLGIRDDALSTLTPAEGDWVQARFDDHGGLWVSLATKLNSTDDTVGVVGTVAHDTADSGNPQKVGNKATTSIAGVTLVADGDRTDAYAGVDGVPIMRPHANLEDIVSGNASNTDGASTQVIAASGSGVKTYLSSVTLTNTSSSNIYVELKDGSTAKWTFPVPANAGVTHTFQVPLGGTANTAWNFDPSAATTTVYCSAVGFKSKV